MKKYVFLIIVASAMSSCSLVKSYSSKTLDIKTEAVSATQADLNVSSEKTNGVAYKKRGLSFKEMKENAVADALSKSHGDVLVEARFMIEKKRNGKVKTVNVSGYSANYKNFRKAEQTCIGKPCCKK